ncbi:MAG: patatin-like phospholipase family protein [Methylobacter sp.]|uniref:patatin-like phospholipase family protein n=1 Tax=Methylobacter sp. TaxID=2051955 RepID=UPI0027306C37|nr:patatin-like phospholipase family protein [Methylobacter sp.]MDP1667199.1 patatin-like phospholipase family protein [Methylobacter sp.]MDP1969713.1 patatin-like phospholipase family protein [Methylobacter sp.]
MDNETDTKIYKILSLDGGGSWALIQAIALADIYGLDTKGRDILKHFDLAIANSGGSIVLAGLIMDMSPRKIFDRFNDESMRNDIFVDKWINVLDFRKYSTKAKLAGLTKAFEGYPIDCKISDIAGEFKISTEIVICAFNYDRERATFFRSNAKSLTASLGGSGLKNLTLLQAIHASSTAPVKYFDDPALIHDNKPEADKVRFWDGAVGGYNNPVMAGLVEVLAKNPKPKNIRALSIGTGNVFLPLGTEGNNSFGLYKMPEKPCLINDINLLAGAIISDPPDAASFTAHVVLGGSLPLTADPVTDGPVVRMNPLVQPIKAAAGAPFPWDLPGFSVNEFIRLSELGLDAVDQYDVNLIKKLTHHWLAGVANNQPVRMNGKTLACEIGHNKYSKAVAQWRSYDTSAPPHSDNNRQKITDIL